MFFRIAFDPSEDVAKPDIDLIGGIRLGVTRSEDDRILAVAIHRVEGKRLPSLVVDPEQDSIVVGPGRQRGLLVLEMGDQVFRAFFQIDYSEVYPPLEGHQAGDVLAVG